MKRELDAFFKSSKSSMIESKLNEIARDLTDYEVDIASQHNKHSYLGHQCNASHKMISQW